MYLVKCEGASFAESRCSCMVVLVVKGMGVRGDGDDYHYTRHTYTPSRVYINPHHTTSSRSYPPVHLSKTHRPSNTPLSAAVHHHSPTTQAGTVVRMSETSLNMQYRR